MHPNIRKICNIVLVIFAIYLFVSYLLPIFLPFLIGAALAFGADPLVRFLHTRLKFPRGAAAAVGITMAFSFLTLAVLVLGAFAVRELRTLAGILPDLQDTAQSGMQSLSGWLLGLAARIPGGLGALLADQITAFFSDGASLLASLISRMLSFATGVLGRLTGSALTLATAIISSFMISVRLPRLKQALSSRLDSQILAPVRAAVKRLKSAVGGWLMAQLKLCSITWLLTTAGLLLLRIPHAFLWALLLALVDAFPILGTGTVLVPWSITAFFQGDRFLALGLLGLYAACALSRSVLEPRLVGKQLGLDPLVTLVALYAGYRLWGFGGMLLAPLLAVTVTQLTKPAA